jgi:hypothetical protein
MQQNHPTTRHREQNASDATGGNVAAYFVDSFFKLPAIGHTDRPSELDLLDISANGPPVVSIQSQQPFAHRFSTRIEPVEMGLQFLSSIEHLSLNMYQK